MVNNIPVNGWPQLKDLEAVQPTLDRLDKIEAWKRTVKEETFTGEEITIPNALALPARSLITEIEPIQDLHGQSAPYVGGAGKNKIPMTVSNLKAWNTDGTWSGNVYTVNNTTIEILTDAANNVTGIKTNTGSGGASALIMFKLSDNTLSVKTGDIISGCPAGGATNTYMLNVSGTPFSDTGSGGTCAADATGTLNLDIFTGAELSNAIWYPMLRDASAPSGFAPYSNICPISGRDSVAVTVSDGDEISEDFTIQLGQTVYGADINWDTGVMTVDRVKVSKTWEQMDNATDLGSGVTRKLCNKGSIGTLLPSSAESISNVCAYLGGGWNDPVIRWFHDDINAFFYLPSNTPNDLLCEWIAPLATPTTIQLTPEQLQMLKGYNRVTLTDGYGTIELKALTGANWS